MERYSMPEKIIRKLNNTEQDSFSGNDDRSDTDNSTNEKENSYCTA